jgi:predicted RNA binding protein YcfA (HicA-like mRNA interferase family)
MLKVREARKLLRASGFIVRSGKGSHEVWTAPGKPGRVTLCGHDNDDLQPYQELRLRRLQLAS